MVVMEVVLEHCYPFLFVNRKYLFLDLLFINKII